MSCNWIKITSQPVSVQWWDKFVALHWTMVEYFNVWHTSWRCATFLDVVHFTRSLQVHSTHSSVLSPLCNARWRKQPNAVVFDLMHCTSLTLSLPLRRVGTCIRKEFNLNDMGGEKWSRRRNVVTSIDAANFSFKTTVNLNYLPICHRVVSSLELLSNQWLDDGRFN